MLDNMKDDKWYLEADLSELSYIIKYPPDFIYDMVRDFREPNDQDFLKRFQNISINYNKFREQLAQAAVMSPNQKAVEIDIKDRFMANINKCLQWYSEHKKETEVYEPHNLIKSVFEIFEKTKKDILKFFPEADEHKKEDDNVLAFTNNFDNVSSIKVDEHFKKGLVDKHHLTEQELNEYLKAAFELKTIPGTLFRIKDARTKAAIINVFYKYYKDVAGQPYGKQPQYAALLGDYFEGYNTALVSSNFSK
jgi:hypothetical protein